MEKPKFESYKRYNGHDEFVEWLNELPIKDQYKMFDVIKNTQNNGLLVAQRMGWVKKIETRQNLYELRSKVSTNIQRAMYFHVENNRYLITHGFTKKSMKTPIREIEHAIKLREEWKEKNANENG